MSSRIIFEKIVNWIPGNSEHESRYRLLNAILAPMLLNVILAPMLTQMTELRQFNAQCPI